MRDVYFLDALQGGCCAIVEHHFHDVERSQQRRVDTLFTLLSSVAHEKGDTATRQSEDVHDGTVVVVSVVMKYDSLRCLDHILSSSFSM